MCQNYKNFPNNENSTNVKHPKCEVVLRVKIPSLMHDIHLCQKMLNLLIASTDIKDVNTKHVIMQTNANITYMSNTKRPDTNA